MSSNLAIKFILYAASFYLCLLHNPVAVSAQQPFKKILKQTDENEATVNSEFKSTEANDSLDITDLNQLQKLLNVGLEHLEDNQKRKLLFTDLRDVAAQINTTLSETGRQDDTSEDLAINVKEIYSKYPANSFQVIYNLEVLKSEVVFNLEEVVSLMEFAEQSINADKETLKELDKLHGKIHPKTFITSLSALTPDQKIEQFLLKLKIELKLDHITVYKNQQSHFTTQLDFLDKEIAASLKDVKFTENDLQAILKSLDDKLAKALDNDNSSNVLLKSTLRILDDEQDRNVASERIDSFETTMLDAYSFLTGVIKWQKKMLSDRYALYNDKFTSKEIENLYDYYYRFQSESQKIYNITAKRVAGIISQQIDFAGANLTVSQQKDLKALQTSGRLFAFQMIELIHTHNSIKVFLEELAAKSGMTSNDYLRTFANGTVSALNYELLVMDEKPITIAKILKSLFLFIIGVFLARFISDRVLNSVVKRFNLQSGVAAAAESISFYLLILCFALLSLHASHIPLTIFTLMGGAIAIGVGFGSQNIMNNFISGIILLIERPVRVGDIVEFSTMRGVVKHIGARSTNFSMPDNTEMIVPNSLLLESNLINWTLSNSIIRRIVKVGVAYGSSPREVTKILLKVAEGHGKVLDNPGAQALFMDFGESALNFELRFWLPVTGVSEALHVESDLRHMIDQHFKDAGIVIAFPQRDLHVDFSGQALNVKLLRGSSKETTKEKEESE